MATLRLSGNLETLAGRNCIEVTALSYRDLLQELTVLLPCLPSEALTELAFVIDGEIVDQPFLATFEPRSELHFIQKIAAG